MPPTGGRTGPRRPSASSSRSGGNRSGVACRSARRPSTAGSSTARSGLAPSTVRQVHAVISGALKQAVKWRWIGYNPARDASLPSARRHRIQPPDPAKVRALIAKAEAHSPEMGLFIRLAALLGARRGELCGLQWGDIHEDSGTVVMRRGVVEIASTLPVKDTKTHSERVVSLDPATAEVLRRHRAYVEQRADQCGAGLVADAFILSPAPDGSIPLRPNLATDVFRRIRHDVGLDTARLHDLRHFVAMQLIGAGHDIRTVSRPARPRPDVDDAEHLRRLPQCSRPGSDQSVGRPSRSGGTCLIQRVWPVFELTEVRAAA